MYYAYRYDHSGVEPSHGCVFGVVVNIELTHTIVQMNVYLANIDDILLLLLLLN